MNFRRAVQRYGRTPAPVTPYQRAAQVWDERIGSARVQARNWRLIAFGGLLLSAGLSSGLLWQSMQSRVVPYVVEVDRLGEARAVAPLKDGYRPTDAQIAWHLGRFIRDVRSISLDPVLMRANWLSAYDLVAGAGGRFLNDYARSAQPFSRVGERTVSVQVTSVIRASDRSFQVQWIETSYERGEVVGVSRWTAILSVRIADPGSADELRRNPLGLRIEGIDWSRELEPSEPSHSQAAPAASPLPAGAGNAGAPQLPSGSSRSFQ